MNKPSCRQYKVFPSPIGPIGIAWTLKGLTTLQLPEKTTHQTKEALIRKITLVDEYECLENSLDIKSIINSINSYISSSLSHQDMMRYVPVDLSFLGPVEQKVYECLMSSSEGATLSYSELALAVGKPGANRHIGQLVSKNPMPLIIPCHRVIYSNGNLGSFNAFKGQSLKRELLMREGALLI